MLLMCRPWKRLTIGRRIEFLRARMRWFCSRECTVVAPVHPAMSVRRITRFSVFNLCPAYRPPPHNKEG